jgi:hypothetical protein
MTDELRIALDELARRAPNRPAEWARGAIEQAQRKQRHRRHAAVGGTAVVAAACVAAVGTVGLGSGSSRPTTAFPAGAGTTAAATPTPRASVTFPTCDGGNTSSVVRPRPREDRTLILEDTDLTGSWIDKGGRSEGVFRNSWPEAPLLSLAVVHLENRRPEGSLYFTEEAMEVAPEHADVAFEQMFRDQICVEGWKQNVLLNWRDGDRMAVAFVTVRRHNPGDFGQPWQMLVRNGARMGYLYTLVNPPAASFRHAVARPELLNQLAEAALDRLEGKAPAARLPLGELASPTAQSTPVPAIDPPDCATRPQQPETAPSGGVAGKAVAESTSLLRPSDFAGTWTARPNAEPDPSAAENLANIPGAELLAYGVVDLEASASPVWMVHQVTGRFGTKEDAAAAFERTAANHICQGDDSAIRVNKRDGDRAMVAIFYPDRKDPMVGAPWAVVVRSGTRVSWLDVLNEKPVAQLGDDVPTVAELEALGRAMQDRLDGRAPSAPVQLGAASD